MRFPYFLGARNRLCKAGLEKNQMFRRCSKHKLSCPCIFFSCFQTTEDEGTSLKYLFFFLQIFFTCILITKFLPIVEFYKITGASHQSLLLVTQHVSMTGGDIKKQAFFAQANRTISFWVPTYSDIK